MKENDEKILEQKKSYSIEIGKNKEEFENLSAEEEFKQKELTDEFMDVEEDQSLKDTMNLNSALSNMYNTMFSNSKAYAKVMSSKYTPTIKDYDPQEYAEFNKRKQRNPHADFRLHMFQKSMDEYLEKNNGFEEEKDQIKVLTTGNKEEKKAKLDEEIAKFMSMTLSLSFLNRDYLAEHGASVAILMTHFERIKDYRQLRFLDWYFEEMTLSQKTQFEAMYDACQCLFDCIELTLRAKGMKTYREDMCDPEYIVDDGKTQKEKDQERKGYKAALKNGIEVYKDSLKRLSVAFGYKKSDKNSERKKKFRRAGYKDSYQALTDEQRQALREKSEYTIKKVPKTTQLMNKEDSEKRMHVKDMSGALMKVMPETYKKMHDALINEDAPELTTGLVHSAGNKLLKQGHDVLEIDVEPVDQPRDRGDALARNEEGRLAQGGHPLGPAAPGQGFHGLYLHQALAARERDAAARAAGPPARAPGREVHIIFISVFFCFIKNL